MSFLPKLQVKTSKAHLQNKGNIDVQFINVI